MWNLKTLISSLDTNELIYKTEIQIHRQKNKPMVTKGERGVGVNKEFGINIYTLL